MKKFELNEEELDILIRVMDYHCSYISLTDEDSALLGKLDKVKQQLQQEEGEES